MFGSHVELRGDFGYLSVSVSSTGDTLLVPAIAGEKIWMHGLIIGTLTGPSNISFKGGPASIGPLQLASFGGSLALDPTQVAWYETSPGNALVMNQTGTSLITGWIVYRQG